MRKIILLLILAVTWGLGNAWGQMIDEEDPPLWVYSPGCGGPLYGGETFGLCDGSSIDIQNHGNVNKSLVSPLLVILGIPGGGTAPTLTYDGTDYSAGGTAMFGWNGSSSQVTFSASSGGSVYDLLGLSNGSGGASSENFGNWANWDQQVNGFTPTMFGIYVYELTTVALPGAPSGGTPITVQFSGGLPLGSYVVAAGCTLVEPSGQNLNCASIAPPSEGHVGATPFTHAGLVNHRVMEPTTSVLLGVGLLGLVGLARKRRVTLA